VTDHLPTKYRDLVYQKECLEEALATLPDDEQVRVHEAIIYAEDAHGMQTRDDGDPYVIHVIRAARTLIEDLNCLDADMIISTLLHDVVEDATYVTNSDHSTYTINHNPPHTFPMIEERFGARVAEFVRALTQDKGVETKQAYIERIIAGPREVRLMKAADKLDNVRSLALREDRGERWQRHIWEAETLHIALAESTGEDYFVVEMHKALKAVLD